MRYKSILLFGAPGSGKGTQGKILSAIPGFFHISTGDIFRSINLQSEIGRIFLEYSSRGELVPDEVTTKVFSNYVKGKELVNEFYPENQFLVMDGIPRDVQQAKLIEPIVEVVKVIHLRCADMNKMVERLRRRALRENRIDDAKESVIRNRIEVYETTTRRVLDVYPEELIARLDATMSMIGVLSEIVKILRPLKEEADRIHDAGRKGPSAPPIR